MKTDLTHIIVSLLKKELEEKRFSKEQDSYGIKALIANLEPDVAQSQSDNLQSASLQSNNLQSNNLQSNNPQSDNLQNTDSRKTGLQYIQEQYQKRVLSMNVNLDLLGIQVVERAKRMKRDKSNDYIEGFDDACALLLEYQSESLELTRHDQDNK